LRVMKVVSGERTQYVIPAHSQQTVDDRQGPQAMGLMFASVIDRVAHTHEAEVVASLG
jgi:hypothetical protein